MSSNFVLSPHDHEQFAREGFVVIKDVVPPAVIREAVEFLDGGTFEGDVGAANYRALDGPPVQACLTPPVVAAIAELFGPGYTFVPGSVCDMPRPLQSGAEWTSQNIDVDDDYPMLMPASWAVGIFLFLTPVRSHGGAFHPAPGSPWRYRAAVAERPESLALVAKLPELSCEAPEFLAQPGDLLLFHHMMGHAGTSNVTDPQTRHALLGRFHPRERIVPGDKPFEHMTTIERANSARWAWAQELSSVPPLEVAPSPALDEALACGIAGEGASDILAHVPFRTREGVGLWAVEAAAPGRLRRLISRDFAAWASDDYAPEWPAAIGALYAFERDPAGCLWVTCGETTHILSGTAAPHGARAEWEEVAQMPSVECASGHTSTDYGGAKARGHIVLFAAPHEPEQLRCCWGTDWASAVTGAQNEPVARLTPGERIADAWVKPALGEGQFALIVQTKADPGSVLYALSPDCARFDMPLQPLPHAQGHAMRGLRVGARARNFWFVSYVRDGRLFWGTVDWGRSPVQVQEISTARALQDALSVVGWY